MLFPYAQANFKEAQALLIGIPDESKCLGRRGCSLGPDYIRKVATMHNVFKDGTLQLPQVGEINFNLCDLGNIKKSDISSIPKLKEKLPIFIGGDHSITFEIIKALNYEKLSIIYFDAHPDAICSRKKYFGSVVCDILNAYPQYRILEIGTRAMNKEELSNLENKKIKFFSPMEIDEKRKKILAQIKKIGKPIYLSIDMDCFDPAFAPGVCTPSPFGLNPNFVLEVAKLISNKIVGFDIMQTNPNYDLYENTGQIASNLIINILALIFENKK